MIRQSFAVAAIAITLLAGCAMSPTVQYKSGTGPVTASVSDDGLSMWTDMPGSDVRLAQSNVYVSGAPTSFFFVGVILVDNTSAGNARLAKQIPPEFGVTLAPAVTQSLQRAAEALKPRTLNLSNQHAANLDMHLTPMVRMIHIGDGNFNLEPQVKVDFLDSEGKRQTRTYLYNSGLALPVQGAGNAWGNDKLRLFHRHLSHAYGVLAQVILMDQQGRFQKSLNAETPNVIKESKAGLVTVKLILIEDLGDALVTHEMVGSNRGTQRFIVEDKRTAAQLVIL